MSQVGEGLGIVRGVAEGGRKGLDGLFHLADGVCTRADGDPGFCTLLDELFVVGGHARRGWW